jgi:hypothetical protein
MFDSVRGFHRLLGVTGRKMILWDEPGWGQLRDELEKLLADSTVSVHTRQIQPQTKKEVDASATRLTTTSPLAMGNCGDCVLIDFEIFSPSRSESIKRRVMPEMYFQVTNPNSTDVHYRFDQLFHMIISTHFWNSHLTKIQEFMSSVYELTDIRLLAHTRTRYSNMNEFESFLLYQFFYPDLVNSDVPELSKLKGSWKSVVGSDLSGI